MQHTTPAISDRTGADEAIGFVLGKLRGFDTGLLDWVRVYPMTENQHRPRLAGEAPPATLSVCWTPRNPPPLDEPPGAQHKFRIKANIWQGRDYPACERNWGRVPPVPIRRNHIADRYTTRGLCEWSYPDRLAATVHALARPLFLYLAHTRQLGDNPSDSNASAFGHRWLIEWLRSRAQHKAADTLTAQLMQWTIIRCRQP